MIYHSYSILFSFDISCIVTDIVRLDAFIPDSPFADDFYSFDIDRFHLRYSENCRCCLIHSSASWCRQSWYSAVTYSWLTNPVTILTPMAIPTLTAIRRAWPFHSDNPSIRPSFISENHWHSSRRHSVFWHSIHFPDSAIRPAIIPIDSTGRWRS